MVMILCLACLGIRSLTYLGNKERISKLNQGVRKCCAKCKSKITRSIPSSMHKATRYLERVHMDTCGPLQMKTCNGNIYFTVFVDEYT